MNDTLKWILFVPLAIIGGFICSNIVVLILNFFEQQGAFWSEITRSVVFYLSCMGIATSIAPKGKNIILVVICTITIVFNIITMILYSNWIGVSIITSIIVILTTIAEYSNLRKEEKKLEQGDTE